MVYWGRCLFALCVLAIVPVFADANVRIKDLARVEGVRTNPLVGYGIVVGLSGSGDTSRSKATLQSVANALEQFGVKVERRDVNSRNVAAVMITADMPAFASVGDKIDINVSSLGDARSLVGGTLLMTPLKGANEKVYALAQGQVSVGGFQYDLNGNMVQKNHTTVGRIPSGGIVEVPTNAERKSDGGISLVLNQPDFTTADRIVAKLSTQQGVKDAWAIHPGKVRVLLKDDHKWVSMMRVIENLKVEPDRSAIVVVNERTGTVISGGEVTIDNVTISHGELKVIISTDYRVSQPTVIGFGASADNARTVVVPDTEISVDEGKAKAVGLRSGSTVSDLVAALQQINISTRDLIIILQGIKSAGALNAKLVIQ